MRTRAFSSVFVVGIGLVPTFVGGWAFVILMLVIAIVGFQEFSMLTNAASGWRVHVLLPIAAIPLIALAVIANIGANAALLAIVAFLAIVAPLVALFSRVGEAETLTQWALLSTGLGYVGMPMFTAIVLRSLTGGIDGSWLASLVDTVSRSPLSGSRGLAWTLLTILVIWIGDTAAYLVGRAIGKRKLSPRISPGKTVEGALGGLLGATLTAAAAFALFGLGPAWIGSLAGAVIGGMGQLGDLCESFIKRQAGRKDSGNIVPGHGGLLDRVDALFFAFPTALALAMLLEWLDIP